MMKFKELKEILRPEERVELSIADDNGFEVGIIFNNEPISNLDKKWFVSGYFDDYMVISVYADFLHGKTYSDSDIGLIIVIRKDGT